MTHKFPPNPIDTPETPARGSATAAQATASSGNGLSREFLPLGCLILEVPVSSVFLQSLEQMRCYLGMLPLVTRIFRIAASGPNS